MNFHPPPPHPHLFLSPLLSFLFLITSTKLWFYCIITKIHPPFQDPGSAPDYYLFFDKEEEKTLASWVSRSLGFHRACQNVSKDLQRLKAVRKRPEKHVKETTYGCQKEIYLFMIGFSNGYPRSRGNNRNKYSE